VNIVPTSNLFDNYYGDSLRVVIKNIEDLNGNIQTASDTLEFLVGGSVAPTASNVKKKRVSISNVNPLKTSIFENSGDSLMVKFKFDTTSNTTSRTLVRFIVGGSAQYNTGYTVSYSNGQSLATVYNGTEGSITIPAYQDSAILTIKPIADAVNESDETIMLSLVSGGDYTISSNYLIRDTIKNDDNLGTPLITSSGQLCQGGSITLSTGNMINGQPVSRYEWKSGATIVGTAQNLIVTTSGVYTVTVYNSSRFSGTSNAFTVTASAPPSSVSNFTVCSNQLPFSWNNANYSAAGTYSKTISNANGCDSIAVLNLSISAPITSIETVNAVDSFEWHGVTYYASTNTPTWTYSNAIGCDSLVTLHLTMTYTCLPVATVLNVTACNSYVWHGLRFFSSTEIEWVGTTSRGGCDSVVTLYLTINRTTRSTTNVSICNNQLPYRWNGVNYTSGGTYTKQLINAAGCDSIATLVLSVKLPTSSTQSVAICANEVPYIWNGISYNTSGTYVKMLTNAAGCDSTATLVLNVKPVSTTNTIISICSNQLPFTWNGLTLTASGTYTASFNNMYGCDSMAILNLTVKPVSYVTETIDATGTSYTWHGVVYTSSNHTASWTGTNAAGCDSVVTLDLTLTNNCVPTTRVFNVSACNSYIWHGLRFTSSTTIDWIGVNVAGCDSIETLNLTISTLSPTASPASITQTLVNNTCGSRVYRYTAAAVTNASGYAWTLPISVGGITGVYVDSGDINNSRIILVRYASTQAAFTTDSVRVRAFSPCSTTSSRAAKLNNTLYTVPTAPASITITPIVTNICGAKRYRYAAPALPASTTTAVAATGYIWQFKGVLGATIDSGTVNSRVITVTFSNNAAANTGDSVKLCYTSDCGNSLFKASKLTNTAISAPAAPIAITITQIDNPCTTKRYRYAAPALTAGTTTLGAAEGYQWVFTGTLGTLAVIDSGNVNSQVITVTFGSMATAATGDSVKVAYTSGCGLSDYKTAKLTNVNMGLPVAPASITITSISTVICGAKKYRYAAPALPAATTSTYAATGYVWSFVGTLGANAVIDSGSINSQVITVTYTMNEGATNADSVKLYYTSVCGNSPVKASKLTNNKLTAPLPPASISISLVSDACGARVYRYTAPAFPATSSSSITAAPTGYLWTMPKGSIGSTGVLDSGSITSRIIRIRYSSNAAATTGDSIILVYTSGCGSSTPKAQKLSNAAQVIPSTPSTLTGTTSICPIVGTPTGATYTVSTTTNAATYLWTVPTGALIDSGSNGLKIRVVYSAAGASDSIAVQGVSANGCLGSKKILKLVTTGCATTPIYTRSEPVIPAPIVQEPMSVQIYPNPTTSAFSLFVKSPRYSQHVKANVRDAQGRLIKTLSFSSDETISFGNELKSGVYFIEVREGKEVRIERVVKY